MLANTKITNTFVNSIEISHFTEPEAKPSVKVPAREELPKPPTDITVLANFLEELEIVEQKTIILEQCRRSRYRLDLTSFKDPYVAAYEATKILTNNFFVLRNRIIRIKTAFKTANFSRQINSEDSEMDMEGMNGRIESLWKLYQMLKERLYDGRFKV